MIRTDRLELIGTSDLFALNRAICSEIKRRNSEKNAEVRASVKVGDYAQLATREGTVRVRVIKVNLKTAVCVCVNFDGTELPLRYKAPLSSLSIEATI
jgi:hypothetical protein